MAIFRSLFTLSPLKIAAGYFVFGIFWIPSTDILLAILFGPQQLPTLIGLSKGWVFIGISSGLIYLLSLIYQKQMATTQTRLETANEQLQVFHRVFRHNLRNDLTIIRGYTNNLTNKIDDGEALSQLETVVQTANQLITISEKLAVVEKMNPEFTTDDPVDLVNVDLVKIIDTELERLRTSSPQITVETSTPSTAWVEANESIQYAIREVFENAVTHYDGSSSACELTIHIQKENGNILLAVSDNGPGITKAELQALRSEEETPLIHASSVGLWLIKWVSRLNAATVAFKSSPDEGTTVMFRFCATPEIPGIDESSSLFQSQTLTAK